MTALTSTLRFNEPSLSDVLRDIHFGKIQLPDFQRWVGDEDRVRSLPSHNSLSYPVGAIRLLVKEGDSVRFPPQLITGVELAHPAEPNFFTLDGQQRMTSLNLSLRRGKPFIIKNKQDTIDSNCDLISSIAKSTKRM